MAANQLLEFTVFKLPDLPYAYDALKPTMSAETLHLHHDKHHAAYVKTTNELVETLGAPVQTLEEVVLKARREGDAKLFHNAAQAWNHAFFWNCMTPGGSKPQGDLDKAITQAFGGLEQLKQKFVAEGVAHFGSGWVWLIADGNDARVISTHDAGDTLTWHGVTPLLVCDLWEHAYYLDYQNDRAGFLEKWFDALPDWSFAAHQLSAAGGQGQPWRYPTAPEPQRRHA